MKIEPSWNISHELQINVVIRCVFISSLIKTFTLIFIVKIIPNQRLLKQLKRKWIGSNQLNYGDPHIMSRSICWVYLNPWMEWSNEDDVNCGKTNLNEDIFKWIQLRSRNFLGGWAGGRGDVIICNYLNCNYNCDDHIFI